MRWLSASKRDYLPLAATPVDDHSGPFSRVKWRAIQLSTLALFSVTTFSVLDVLFINNPLAEQDRLLLKSAWRPVYLSEPLSIPSAAPTSAQQLFNEDCADLWIAKGQLCEPLYGQVGTRQHRHLDVVIPWVNGSDALLTRIVTDTMDHNITKPRHFREHQELIHNLRSLMTNVPSEIVRRIYLLTADIAPPCTVDVSHEDLRMGSVPTWLNLPTEGRSFVNSPELHVLHHSQFFRSRVNDSVEANEVYLNGAVPSFNSMAIESSLGGIRDLTETIFYSNDDVLLLRDAVTADFATPLFGPVFRASAGYRMSAHLHGDVDGEFPSMGWASSLLDARFGTRSRPYLSHGAKSLSRLSMREAASIWKEELDEAASSRFRGEKRDINANFLHTHYHVEKHREALLWSLMMARFDANHDGQYDDAERAALWKWLEEQSIPVASTAHDLAIRKPQRDFTREEPVESVLGLAGLAPPRWEPYVALSMDGYAYLEPSVWPRYPIHDRPPASQCVISLSTCFPKDFFTASNTTFDAQAVFRMISFGFPECGDCLVAAGLTASGYRGLEAFLPTSSRQQGENSWQFVTPQLAMADKSYEEADFSVASVMSTWVPDLRSFCVRLIQRYQYAMANGASVRLFSIEGSLGLEKNLQSLEYRPGLAQVAINDDIASEDDVPEVNTVLEKWMEEKWGSSRTIWEKLDA